MRHFVLLFGLVSAFCLLEASAEAWSKQSHMTTGAIAYDDLAATSPEMLKKVNGIIESHPDYEQFQEHSNGLVGADKMRAVFEWLARWADDVRGTPKDKPDLHYELRVVYGWTWLWPFRNGNASIGFDENFRTLSSSQATDRDRAVALGWLIHIIGDMHQPLHTGHQLTGEFPTTDEAGLLSFVVRTHGGTPIELHEYWDQVLDVTGSERATSNRWSISLQRTWPRKKISELTLYSGTPQVKFGNWIDESMHLAKIFYRDIGNKATADSVNAPSVTPHELRFTEELSKRRIATSGYRIADTIRLALR